MFNPFANIAQTMQQFNNFSQNFRGNPLEQVQQMLNSGQMSQDQFNRIMPLAQQMYQMLHGGKN